MAADTPTMRVKLTAIFWSGLRITRTYEHCQDIPDALDRFERDARKPVNLGAYNVVSAHFGFEESAS